jgi:CheY-like chemotaxis protein
VLVVEDEEPVRAALVEALERAGHDVHAAADGASGLAKIEQGRFDVVLADLALPERSGLALARAVKRVSPLTRVVLITGWGHLLDGERLREHGVDLMLVKPVRPARARRLGRERRASPAGLGVSACGAPAALPWRMADG